MADCDWLVRRPIAHRGLHDAPAGRFENTVSAARAAIMGDYAIECDVQGSADGEAVVFHDFTLERLTGAQGAVKAQSASTLAALSVGGSTDRIVGLPAFLDAIDGRTPLVCEIKSAFDGDFRLTDRVADLARRYRGPLGLKSFDPAVIAHLRSGTDAELQDVPLGIVAEANYDDPEWDALPSDLRRDLAALVHIGDTRPDFLSYHVQDLPHAAAALFRGALGRPVMAWTVRTPEQRRRASLWADQMVFEGFEP